MYIRARHGEKSEEQKRWVLTSRAAAVVAYHDGFVAHDDGSAKRLFGTKHNVVGVWFAVIKVSWMGYYD